MIIAHYLSSTPVCCGMSRAGSHQAADRRSASREFHPSCRSDRAALIAWQTVTGREYHYPLGCCRHAGGPRHRQAGLSLTLFWVPRALSCTGSRSHAPNLMYLMNGMYFTSSTRESAALLKWASCANIKTGIKVLFRCAVSTVKNPLII